MENGITIKKWKMNWEWLLKNYLSPELWNKSWTLFQYKEFVITLNIYCIYTKRDEIAFDIKCEYVTPAGFKSNRETTISFSLKIEDITFLKRKINSAIFEVMVGVETNKIVSTDEYAKLKQLQYEEQDKLRDIANEFLDKNNIENRNIREAYTDAYIDEYAQVPDMISDYVDSKIYTIMTDFYLIWLDTLEDDPKREIRTREIQEKLNEGEYEDIMKRVKEYEEYMETEEFTEDMEDNLEEV